MSALAVRNEHDSAIVERVVIQGDLSKLTPEERVNYYRSVCSSLGLNPLTKPFEYIVLNNRLTLYALKGATDQLRDLHNVSLTEMQTSQMGDLYVVTVKGQDATGRTDVEMGVVNVKGLAGDNLANAMMKAVTKAKRRLTLSLCGLGWLDETELDTIPSAQPVQVVHETGEILDAPPDTVPTHTPPPVSADPITQPQVKKIWATAREKGIGNAQLHYWLLRELRLMHIEEMTKQQATVLIDTLVNGELNVPDQEISAAFLKDYDAVLAAGSRDELRSMYKPLQMEWREVDRVAWGVMDAALKDCARAFDDDQPNA